MHRIMEILYSGVLSGRVPVGESVPNSKWDAYPRFERAIMRKM